MILLKIAMLAVLDALGLYAVITLLANDYWPVAVVVAVVTLGLNWLYLSKRAIPLKFLAPGLILLLVFQLFLVAYSTVIAFTNYGFGHNSTKDDAILALEQRGWEQVPDSPVYQLAVLDQDTVIWFLLTDPDLIVTLGNDDTPLELVTDAETDDSGKAIGLDGFTTLAFGDILARQAEILETAVPVSEDPSDGVVRTSDGRTATEYQSVLVYDPEQDAMVNLSTGVVYPAREDGVFASDDGEVLLPGWRVFVGLENFARVIGSNLLESDMPAVFLWTFAFAFLVTFISFALGMFLALVFNDRRMRGRTAYRALVILPYAFPAFLSILVWGGMANVQFGFINEVLLGGAEIPWLRDPWWARFSVIFVAVWLTTPFKFLISTGALQSIPHELEEAAILDGAGKWQLFRWVRLPLLLVTLAPALIASFAVTFNGFNFVWLLTKGGPVNLASDINAGATDLLITLVYKIAFVNKLADFGLASAYTVIIFLIIGAVSVMAFRRTRRLEELA
jgi:arabinogalactan oligomer/maltooligosaccharide transport system permease protein